MTARRKNRSPGRRALPWFVTGIIFFAAMDGILITAHFAGWIMITLVIAGAAWGIARRTAPAQRESTALAKARKEIETLNGKLADARASANAAWDAAAEREPARPRELPRLPARDALISDPRSGVRRLGNTE